MNAPSNLLEQELAVLAAHLGGRREAILHAWRRAVRKDPVLTTADSLPRVQLNDHIPGLLKTYECRLDPARESTAAGPQLNQEELAAAHGLHRWQQGYDLLELSRELGRLNECLVLELEDYARSRPQLPHEVMATARWVWAELSGLEFSDSIAEYFRLQQVEAAGHMSDLESALEKVRELEQQRADLWHQAAHDLRGNLGVVMTATAGLSRTAPVEGPSATFLRLLDRNVASLHKLLDDVTDLARLQAGKERRQLAEVDAAGLLGELCDGLAAQAEQQGLFLKFSGPSPFVVEGDAVKLRRLAQNLIHNATKYTRRGGVTVSWGDSRPNDSKRWLLCVHDTGPGFDAGPGAPLIEALGEATDLTRLTEAGAADPAGAAQDAVHEATHAVTAGTRSHSQQPGEGIGLSIVKRLAELLHASIEVESSAAAGTTFRIYVPRHYGD